MDWRRLMGIGLLLATASPAIEIQADEGQYRSKVAIDPSGALGKGVALSIEQLQQQLDGISDPYAKSSASRHLARHYIQSKQYDKAVAYYQTALAAEGLSDLANRQMLRELAQVYLLSEDYAAAVLALERLLQFDLVQQADDYLLLAQAHYRMGKYVAVVATLDQLQAVLPALDIKQMRQALTLYYRAGAYAQSGKLLQQLLLLEPHNPEHWHQLAAIYLLQNEQRKALDQLVLAFEKGVPFTEQDILLLVDLYGVNHNPYAAATLLESSLQQETIAQRGEYYRKLFAFWLQARENDQAMVALAKAARLTGDTELYLHLAQLQMEQQSWQAMQATVVAACSRQIADQHVGRANLLLGISHFKLGDRKSARRAFINATLIGGVNTQAAQWLQFMDAEAATKGEARRIVSPCYGPRDKRGRLSADAADYAEPGAELAGATTQTLPPVSIKTVAPMQLFYSEHKQSAADMTQQAKPLLVRLGITLVKSGGSVDGPLHLIADNASLDPTEPRDFQLALPVRGNPRGGGRFKTRTTATLRCSYIAYKGPIDDVPAAWAELARNTLAAGYTLSGESRTVFAENATPGTVSLELQLGVE